MRASAHRVRLGCLVVPGLFVLAGCASGDSENPFDVVAETHLAPVLVPDDVTGELVLTRQRDLIDRGLVNVMVRNESTSSLSMGSIELVADYFASGPVTERAVTVRGDRNVAVQVAFGDVVDCESDRPIEAVLAFEMVLDGDSPPQRVRLDLGGGDILDSIRASQCTTQAFREAVRVTFANTEVDDETVVTDLVLEPTGAGSGMTIEEVSGTILVGARLREGRAGDDRAGVRLDEEPVTIPLTFVVNRCDPHALAEVTKRYGLDVAVSIDDARPADVAIDVADLVDSLDSIVERCAANGG
jgi:hypothetical protein